MVQYAEHIPDAFVQRDVVQVVNARHGGNKQAANTPQGQAAAQPVAGRSYVLRGVGQRLRVPVGAQFTQQCKVASVEKIRDLISLQLPGIPLSALPVAPRQLPYHAGFVYFRLDDQSQAWQMLDNASGFAFHVAGSFPGLEMQFWAIRS